MTPQETLLKLWHENTAKLIELISRFTADRFNQKPADGGWTAAEVAEHILIVDKRLTMVLEQEMVAAGRDPHEKLTAISERVEDRVNKIVAPEPFQPSGSVKDQQVLIADILIERKKVDTIIQEKNLALLNETTPHRFFGSMTALEWIIFEIKHTERHFPQLEALLS